MTSSEPPREGPLEPYATPLGQNAESTQPGHPSPTLAVPPPKKPNGLALSALIVGIGAFLVGLAPVFGALVGVVAVLLGIFALRKQQSKAMAITGVVLGGIALLTSLAVTVGIGALVNSAPQDRPSAVVTPTPTPSASPTVEETPAAPSPVPSTAPSPSVAEQPDPVAFRAQANGHLDDMTKDLDDLVVTVDEGGFFRLYSNAVELSFNFGQLQALETPESVVESWTSTLVTTDSSLTALDDAIETEDGATILAAIADLRAQLEATRTVANSAS